MIKSEVYRLSRTELARIASEEYVRKYWWIVVPVPATGIFFTIFGHGPLQFLGGFMILWPFSIPARSVVSTTKASRLFNGGCHVEATEDEVVFIGEYFKGKRLRYPIPMNRIREVAPRRELLLVHLRTPELAPIRADAFKTDEDRQAFIDLIEHAVALRYRGDEVTPA